MRRTSERAEELIGFWREVAPHFDQWDNLPIFGQRGIEGGERVGDPAPFLHGSLGGIAAMNGVPDHRPDHTESLQRSPQCFWMKTAAAPYTPAVPGNVPGTILHASHAGLNARRLTSVRSGWNSLSPA